ncbi:MAG: ATP-binding protein [Candidatus Eisenbacteria bacterium]
MNDSGPPPEPHFVAELLELMDEAVVLHAPDGSVLACNPATERLLGFSLLTASARPSLFSGLAPVTVEGAPLCVADEPAQVALRTGARADLRRLRVERPDGELVWIAARAVPIRAARTSAGEHAGVVTGALTVLVDQSEQVLAEQHLRGELQSDSFGELAGSVAHDFNHFLTVIVGYADLMLHSLPGGDPMRDHADHVHTAAVGAAKLARELMDFSRRQRRPLAVADLVETIHGMQPLLSRMLGPRIRLQLELDRRSAWVRADSAQLERVIFNLALNARDAMHGRGTLTLTTRPVQIDPEFVRSHPGAQVGRFVRLSVRDDGEGMAPETRARLFEPYFTTKPPGQGTGLGLASVWGVVKQFGGYIEVESAPGSGAEFRIDLPAHAGAADRRVAVG